MTYFYISYDNQIIIYSIIMLRQTPWSNTSDHVPPTASHYKQHLRCCNSCNIVSGRDFNMLSLDNLLEEHLRLSRPSVLVWIDVDSQQSFRCSIKRRVYRHISQQALQPGWKRCQLTNGSPLSISQPASCASSHSATSPPSGGSFKVTSSYSDHQMQLGP